MSIFNETLSDELIKTLSIRQELMGKTNRTPQELTFLNSKTNWISLKSSVDVNNDKGNLAKANVLEGGTLSNNGKLKSGVSIGGDGGSYNNNNNVLGIRPMPGITSVNIENIGAYGSTRKATINFQCWDVNQLETLEQLYMRPGYLVLLEFGRTIYLENNKIVQNVSKYDFFNKQNIVLLDELNKLYELSVNSNGNYDALLGYVVNYGWNARLDGGYDCKTEIISTGEVLESLKTNYSLATDVNFAGIANNTFNFQGKLIPGANISGSISNDDFIKINQDYSSNILAGVIRELHTICKYKSPLPTDPTQLAISLNGTSSVNLNIAKLYYDSTDDSQYYSIVQGGSKQNYYITLESFIDVLNKLIIPQVKTNSNSSLGNLTQLSVHDRMYTKAKGAPLKCLYNAFMTSVNPDVCFIKNNYWIDVMKGINIVQVNADVNVDISKQYTTDELNQLKTEMKKWVAILGNNKSASRFASEDDRKLVLSQISEKYKFFVNTKNIKPEQFFQQLQQAYQQVRGGFKLTNVEIPESRDEDGRLLRAKETTTQKSRSWILIEDNKLKKKLQSNFPWNELVTNRKLDDTFSDLFSTISDFANLTSDQKLILEGISNAKVDTNLDKELDQREINLKNAEDQVKKAEDSKTKLNILSDTYKDILTTIPLSFIDETSTKGRKFGIIGNIYLNLKYLYRLATDINITSQDPSGKNTLSLSQFITDLIKNVQSSIGNVNDFELHIDDRDGIGRIIDLNYLNPNDLKDENIFEFEIGSNKSIVRDLKLESKIFSDQVSMMAISAQASSGRLGYNNTTLVNYNKGITNRLLPSISSPSVVNDNLDSAILISSLSNLISQFFVSFVEDYFNENGKFNAAISPSCQYYLRDIINYFTALYNTDNKNSSFIPAYLSITIDGIGGLVIGNIIAIDKTFIPKSYKNNDNKKFKYVIMKINQELNQNDWTTTIDAIPLPPLPEKGNEIEYPTDFTVIIYYDPNTGQSQVNNITSLSRNKEIAYDKAEKETPGFKNKVKAVAKAIGAAEMDLVKIMFVESAGTLNPAVRNNIGCVGLIQFCPDEGGGSTKTIGRKKYQLSQLQTMNRIQQMDVVQEYFNALGYNGSKPLSLTDMYLSTFYPAAVGKPSNFIIGSERKNKEYQFLVAQQNPGIAADSTTFINNKKVIDVKAVTKFISK